jgi:DNA-binding response OmpR family regulator
MPNILVAVTNANDASEIQDELREFGYRAKTVEGCEDVLRHARLAAETGVEAMVVDSKLVGVVASDGRNLVEELKAINNGTVAILVVMTRPLSRIGNEITKQALTQSDAVVYAPASPSDVRLALETLLTSR